MSIKINFSDFWPGFKPEDIITYLKKYYPVTLDNDPDYLFYSVYGNTHLKYTQCIKILFTGENLLPDFNLCDYALGFHYIDFGDRYLRFPLYVYYQWFYKHNLNISNYNYSSLKNDRDELCNRKFCNFIYSNNVNADPTRDNFFYALSKYKKVDSGGRHLNNMGHPVLNKMDFIRKYKFTIAFENSSVPGYTTEKLLEPILMKSMPIYYGNALVHLDFNVDSFIQVKDTNDFDRAIDEIVFLDTNDDIYLERLKMSNFNEENTQEKWEVKLLDFLNDIFKQPMVSARRRPEYGFTKFHIEEQMIKMALFEKQKRINMFKAKTKKVIDKYFYKLLIRKK